MSQEYSASMAAKLLGIGASTLKQWEKHFPELANKQDAKGKNIYGEKEIELLKIIQNLTKERGFTLDGARTEWLKSKDTLQAKANALAQLRALRGFLVEMKENLQ